MTFFVNWALDRRYRLILLAAIFALLIPPVTTALLVLETLKRGSAVAATSALASLVLIGLAGFAGGGASSPALATGVVALVSGVAMGALLRRSQALTLAFQGTVLGAFVVVVLVSLAFPDPESLIAPLRDQVLELVEGSGRATPEDMDVIRELSGFLLLRLLVAGATILLLGALMLGAWWFSLTAPEAEFGREFRGLKLGRALGTASLLLFAVSAFIDVAIVANLAAVAMAAFLFQGLAVMHAWGHAKGWHAAVLGVVYLSLLLPQLTALSTFALCATGLLDNIFALRAPLGRQA